MSTSSVRIDAEKLAKGIDAIPGICEDGKKAVRKLFEEGFGVVFEDDKEIPIAGSLEIGKVYEIDSNAYILGRLDDGENKKLWYSLISLSTGNRYSDTVLGGESIKKCFGSKKYKPAVAKTAEEYFKLKFTGKL